MKRFLLSRVWGMYSEIVHQTLFFEVVTHGPLGFLSKVLATIAAMTEDKQMIMAILFALLLSLLKTARDDHNGEAASWVTRQQNVSKRADEKKKGKVFQPRDKYGRFIKRRNKRRR